MHWHKFTGTPSLIIGQLTVQSKEDPTNIAMSFFKKNKALWGMENPIQNLLLVRSIDLEYGKLLHFQQTYKGVPVAATLQVDVSHEGVITGITGKYSDRRDIEKNAQLGDSRCHLAIEMEVYRIKKYIGAYMAALGHVDAIVFTAGVGEKSVMVRRRAMENLAELGIKLDLERNNKACSSNREFIISTDDSPVKIFVIPTDEELVFVEDVVAIVEGRYNVHTNFNYSFQDVNYRNLMREMAYRNEKKN